MANQKVDEIYEQYALDPATHETALWEAALKHIRWVLRPLCGEHTDSVAQMALIAAWRQRTSYDITRSSFGHWLRITAKAARKRSLDDLNNYQARFDQPGNDEDGGVVIENTSAEIPDEDQDEDADYAFARIHDLLGDDPELLARLLEGDSVSAAARSLGRSRDAVRWSLRKAQERV